MFITKSSELTRPFSLCCIQCDAGMQIDTPEQALAEGWIKIKEDFDGPSWNYLGCCPDCKTEWE